MTLAWAALLCGFPRGLVAAIVPSSFFGMHILNIENGGWDPVRDPWPNARFGVLRIWGDWGFDWYNLQPQRGQWKDWAPFDRTVDTVRRHDVDIILTLGGRTPCWASSNPNAAGKIAGLWLACAWYPPADMNDWRTYVQTLGTRYNGKIKYWEIWNEVDIGDYKGDADQLVQLTRIASTELKKIDPANKILSPNFANSASPLVRDFLAKGGGAFIDIFSFHRYVTSSPEAIVGDARAFRTHLNASGLAHIPMWNTETAVLSPRADDPNGPALVARLYLTQLAAGVSHVDWYSWNNGFQAIGDSSRVLPLTTVANDKAVDPILPAGTAYNQIHDWLAGASLDASSVKRGRMWTLSISRGSSYAGHIVWDASRSSTFTIPPAWNVTRKRDLRGESVDMTRARFVAIGPSPILLESIGANAEAPLRLKNVTINAAAVNPDNHSRYIIAVESEAAAGVNTIYNVNAFINQGAAKTDTQRGELVWAESDNWAGYQDHIPCRGGRGYAAVYPNTGGSFIHLDSCAVTDSGPTRAVSFTLRFDPSFKSPATNNQISGYVQDTSGRYDGWKTFRGFDLTVRNR